MKLFIVENKIQRIYEFIEAIGRKNWSYYHFPVKEESVTNDVTIRRYLKEVCEQRPDVVLLDAALTEKEEINLDALSVGSINDTEETLTGLKYCQALSKERLGIPIVILTKCPHGQVARTAMLVGADRVLMKADQNENIILQIEELVKYVTPHDSAFYWPLREIIDTNHDVWQREPLRKSLDRFFLNESNVRRFGLFTASLRSTLSPLFYGDSKAEKSLVLGLVKSQVLLSLVDPRLRDHVKHTGNVFWLGYRLFNEIGEFKEPELLTGCVSSLYVKSGELDARKQLLYSWTLASLFHDYGYVDERKSQLTELVSSLFPGAVIKYNEARNDTTWNRNMNLIRNFVQSVVGQSHFLYRYVDFMITSYGSEMEQISDKKNKAILIDHGFISAHRLLNLIPIDKLDLQKKNCVLHAAMAIACHNYVEVLRKWKTGDEVKGRLDIGVFPVYSMLSFCDSIQTWDREIDVDPVISQTEIHDGLLERLVLSDTAYISGSEICELSTLRNVGTPGYMLNIKLRYFIEIAGSVDEACESLGDDIQRWKDSDRLKEVCENTGMSNLLHGHIIYELPMLSGTKEITF